MSNKKIHPEPHQTREVIERMPENTNEDLIYKNGFRYLYLIAGRISELVGKYAPQGTDLHLKTINDEEAVIFPVRTARHRGGWRPVVLPFSKEYEKWTEPVYEWFSKAGPSNPFDLSKLSNAKKKHHSRYFQWKAEEIFINHHWRRERYIRDGQVEPTDSDKRFTLMRLRDQRIRELSNIYEFYDEEIRIFVGLSQPRFSRMPRILTSSQNEPLLKPDYYGLEKMASGYFGKLLKKR